jgi:hypothetical protein
VEKILRKSGNDHERDPLHSAGLSARYRRSTLNGGCEQTASGWDGPRYGASWASQPVRSSRHGAQDAISLRVLMGNCYALLRMRPLSISWAEGFVVISCGKVDYDKSG